MTRIRRRLSAQEKAELWRRWRGGQSLNEIGRALGRTGAVVRQVVVLTGGFLQPTPHRSPRTLSLADREEISRGVSAGVSATEIAARLDRSPSTVCREIARNGGRENYRADSKQLRAFSVRVLGT